MFHLPRILLKKLQINVGREGSCNIMNLNQNMIQCSYRYDKDYTPKTLEISVDSDNYIQNEDILRHLNEGYQVDELLDIGIKREEVYIANIVKCRPPNNRNPEEDECEACLNYLRNQVLLVKPKIVVLLGSVALKHILGKEYGITVSRGKIIEKKGITYIPTWHPAALLRDENKKIDFIRDLKILQSKDLLI